MSALLDRLFESTPLFGANATFIESLYELYLENPASVPATWRGYFDGLRTEGGDRPHAPVREAFARLAWERRAAPGAFAIPAGTDKQAALLRMINAYRVRGHQNANVDPLQLRTISPLSDLDPAFHGLLDSDLDTVFNTGSLCGKDRLSLRETLSRIRTIYLGTIGAEYMHITETGEKRWIQRRLEPTLAKPDFSHEFKRWILKLLTAAEGLERYLHTKYVGQKRFSLEGSDALIPLLDNAIQRAGLNGVKEIVIGMAHRGRLNVLVNILGKPPSVLFREFEGKVDPTERNGSGDVKYHLGASSDVETPGGPVHVALAFNPSHLEIINPVVEGSVRARQHRRGDTESRAVLPILIHGDAAFAGQGVVMETLQMSQTKGYGTGGTLHVVINNQIGFTTSKPQDARSTLYCTDVAKMVQAPIFHVNGDDPEAVVFVTQLALDFVMQFRKDVVVDMICYRRHGHNEADEPAVTQPLMYERIRNHPTPRELYAEQLIAERLVTAEQALTLTEDYRNELDRGHIVSRPILEGEPNPQHVDWRPFFGVSWKHPVDTGVPRERLRALCDRLLRLPQGFEPHPRVARILEARRRMAAGEMDSDWGFAETMAYATLLIDGHSVRLSGQDSARGTFFHRHAVLHDQKEGTTYVPLCHLGEGQADFVVVDSLLSEEAVLAFEYGYATADPNSLVLWEAQFGDFANGAQVVIDQFIAAGEAKWSRLCGLVMLLPHGYEGQGPEHSSARTERFKQLCAEHNLQLCIPTTPAQMFHLLRRQQRRPYRKPLIVFSPKSLLRHKLSTSPLEDLINGGFRPLIGERDNLDPGQVTRIILCSGKVYYHLLEARRARDLQDVAILRLEQLYPFPKRDFVEQIATYPCAREFIWCQEEPQNQGMWDLIKHRFHGLRSRGFAVHFAGRPASAAPAVGHYRVHLQQQDKLVEEALGGRGDGASNTKDGP